MKISGYTFVRNATIFDICIEECVRSLVPVCDEIVVCHAESTDDTQSRLAALSIEWPRIKIVQVPWEYPVGEPRWFIEAINKARGFLKYPMQLWLDADEVLDDSEECHKRVLDIAERKACAWFERLNFVRDAWTLIPDGHCVGRYVARMGPSHLFMPSDEPYHDGEPPIREHAERHPELRIFHYGFLRDYQAFYRKNRENNMLWFGKADRRFIEFEQQGRHDWWEVGDWCDKLQEYKGGYHPTFAHQWLRERGAL